MSVTIKNILVFRASTSTLLLFHRNMSDSLSHSLSREEQEEVAQSKKKVKGVSHVGFQGGQEASSDSPNVAQGVWSGSTSFKNKLVGKIPGAFT